MTEQESMNQYLPSLFQQYIAVSKYSRWMEDKQRREIWPEPAQRYVDNVVRPVLEKTAVPEDEINAVCERAFKAIANTEVLPSMRMLMTAGPALDRDHAAGYNCSFLAIDCQKAFDEILYLLACGTGVGFSVERQFINKLPDVPEELHPTDSTIVVADSKIGWATAFRQLISFLYGGQIPNIDYSKVRAAGERLKTFGGRASGPGPLKDLFEYTIRIFKGAVGRKLSSVECHDIVCKTGEAIVVGGVRRSATISLSDLRDRQMAVAKGQLLIDEYVLVNEDEFSWSYAVTMKKNQPCSPTYKVTLWKGYDDKNKTLLEREKKLNWYSIEGQRSLANNSVAYTEKPDVGIFLEEWKALYQSRSGERGIFNRQGVHKKAKKLGKRDPELIIGTNP